MEIVEKSMCSLGMLWHTCWRNLVAADLQPNERISPLSLVAASLPAGQWKSFKLPRKKKNNKKKISVLMFGACF